MDREKLRRAALALIVGIGGALVWLGSGGNDGDSQINELAGLAMASGVVISLVLLAGSLMSESAD